MSILAALGRGLLSLILALLLPWPGPHMDSYAPLGLILVRAPDEHPDAMFWLLAASLLVVFWAISLGIVLLAEHIIRRGLQR